ncbi:HlyD family efflux transporter periplasmic adaptor subunit [Winogradskyella sp.]|uniref:efflux RND transporter periplasmic adaptor subunit n=1 Tax=Winogradskyella sp. TaxID=1883156 RepID=UPI0025F84C7D|nr:HlyD family efflux transporter periplasmic adaptor subunit [Winogradskyella sp.]
MRLLHFILILICCIACSKNSERIKPQEQELTESVYASVTIQPDSLYQVYAIVSGILDINQLEEGDLIMKDQALIQIINNVPKLNSQNSRLSLDLAKQNLNGSAAILNSIEDEIVAATIKYNNDSINFFRQKNLWKQNIGSKVQYDTKKLNYELTTNNLKLLQNKYHRTKNELQTAVKQAQNNYKTSLIASKDFTVKSKINGKVYALYKEPGEIVTTMEPLASIGSATNFIIELLVDEVDIVRISKNQDILITLDAYNNRIFKGTISKIYPKKDERNQTFKVEALFETPPNILYPGLSGEANIIISKKNNILTIPKAYINNDNKVKTDEGLVTIITGLQNMEYIEVISGITKDTYIYKPE